LRAAIRMTAASPVRLRVALVGCGQIAPVHCRYLRRVPQVEFVAVCAPGRENRDRLAGQYGVPTFGQIDDLLRQARPDVVHLLTPPTTHAQLAMQLLDAGVNVLVEKPMALTTRDADAMIATARCSGRWLTANHVRWFDPVVQRARALLDSGELGRLIAVDVFQGAGAREEHLPPGPHAEWKTALPGGLLLNLAAHPAYLMCGFIGRAETVHTIAHGDGRGRLREVRAVIQGEKALGSLTLSLDIQPFTKRIVLYGSTGVVEADLNHIALTERRVRSLPRLVGKVLGNVEQAVQLLSCTLSNGVEFLRGRYDYYPGMGRHFQELYSAVTTGGEPPVHAEDAREAVRLVEEMWRQAGRELHPAAAGVAYA
jgi:predicted dehydrogenase